MTFALNQEITITASNVDLTNCAREQIHIPSSIQPYGCLVIANKKSLQIIQTSHNSEQIIGYKHHDLIGNNIQNVLSNRTIRKIKGCLKRDFSSINPTRIRINKKSLNLITYENQNYLFLEFEPIDPKYKNDFISFYKMTRKVVEEMQMSVSLQDLSEVIVKNIRELTGFDRVMVYRFDEDESGHIIAEDKQPELDSFLGLRYPATDVPKPARRLYLLNYIRLISDIAYQAVPLPNHPETGEPFDLSYSALRSVSPVHIEYLQNMGVRASMSISLIHENKLWGLIACHHYQPKYLPYEVRSACEFLGKVMSLNLIAKEDQQNLIYKVQIKENLSEIFERLSQGTNMMQELYANMDLLQSIVSATGIAIYYDGEIHLSGITPDNQKIQELVAYLRQTQTQDLFYTDKLPAIYPQAMEFKAIASGVVILYLSRVEQSYIIWFRPEVSQTVSWAGNPNKHIKVEEDGTLTLSPRKSFDLWKQNVTGQSLPWLKNEIQQVMEFRNLLIDIIFKKSNELFELNFELQRSNEELDSFAYIASHDLKEPLRGIYNYSYLLIDDYEQSLDDEGVRKLNTLMSLSKRMEKLIDALLHYSRLGRKDLALQPVDINSMIINDIKPVLEISRQTFTDIRIPQQLPIIQADRMLVEEVFINLINNAIKYNDKAEKWVEINYLIDKSKSSHPILYVRDNGIGILEEHQEIIFRIFKRLHSQKAFGGGTGAGLTIVKKIVERHGGNIWVESVLGKGTTFYFTLAEETK
ncbi:MAG: ATP-binding protein [Pseudanabaenaceae cyanobacterium bins.39]|nr:ATP-binding protein [Pseudanabaenaceae cyanobacterium bins.39]